MLAYKITFCEDAHFRLESNRLANISTMHILYHR